MKETVDSPYGSESYTRNFLELKNYKSKLEYTTNKQEYFSLGQPEKETVDLAYISEPPRTLTTEYMVNKQEYFN